MTIVIIIASELKSRLKLLTNKELKHFLKINIKSTN